MTKMHDIINRIIRPTLPEELYLDRTAVPVSMIGNESSESGTITNALFHKDISPFCVY